MNKSIKRRMNRFHICIVAILVMAGIVTSCSQGEKKALEVPSRSIIVAMPGDVGSTTFDSHNITSLTPTSVPNGWEVVNIDMYTSTITVKAPESFDNEEVESGTLSLKGYTPTGNTKSVDVFLAIVPKEVDYTAAPANCYVAYEPKVRYKFDPTRAGNGSMVLPTANVRLLYQTTESLIRYLDMRDGFATFYIAPDTDDNGNELDTLIPGNAIVGAYDADGNLIWTWHIWVTNTNPFDNTITLGGVTMMNQNLGADTNNEGKSDTDAIGRSYGLYYQWGRKEPLAGPKNWNFSLNADDVLYDYNDYEISVGYVESSEGGSTEWTNIHPQYVVIGNPDNDYDWLYDSHDDALWSAEAKTNNDPCPAGWHVADSKVFESLTISAADDAMMWEEAQKMYGWWLEDTTSGEKYFFSAAGRRNYLDGRLDNMNVNDECPVPWSGYYWTASVDGNKAKALYFNLNTNTRTWNGIETSRSMQRANAMPVRCVKE